MPIDFDALVLAPCAAAFGVPVTYLPAQGAPVSTAPDGSPLTGIFDEKHVEITFSKGDEVSTRHPVLSIRQSVLPGGLPPQQGEIVEIAGNAYVITDVQQDGQGDLKLPLRLAQD